jgi:hypothetical protein
MTCSTLRWLLGWRLDFDQISHAKGRQIPVGIVHRWAGHLLIPCGILRHNTSDDLAKSCDVLRCPMTLPIAASFRWWQEMAMDDRGGGDWNALMVNSGYACRTENFPIQRIIASVGGNLLILRCFGLRHFSVIEQVAIATATHESSENPVKSPHFHMQPSRPWAEANAGS